MIETGTRNVDFGADKFGFSNLGGVNWNLGAPQLYEHALQGHEAHIAEHGPLVADTGVHTGRSPKDKFVVRDAETDPIVWWDNNNAMSARAFRRCCSPISSPTPRARRSLRRTSTAAPIRAARQARASSPNLPGTRCSSAIC